MDRKHPKNKVKEDDDDGDADDEDETMKPVEPKKLSRRTRRLQAAAAKIENELDEEQRLILDGIRKHAPEVVAERFKKIREWEENNPDKAQRFEEQFQEYLLQQIDEDNAEIQLPDGNTSEEMITFLTSLTARQNEWKSKRIQLEAKHRKIKFDKHKAPVTTVKEETLPTLQDSDDDDDDESESDDDDDEVDETGFKAFELESPPVEYEDSVYGNARYLDFRNLRPLEELKGDSKYDEMFGMVSNKKFEKIKFGSDTPPPPEPESVEQGPHKVRKKKKIPKKLSSQIDVHDVGMDKIKNIMGAEDDKALKVTHIPRNFMFSRPGRKVLYMDIPAAKEDYGANWSRIQKDTKKKVRKKKRLPEFLQSEEQPKELYNLIIQKEEINSLAKNAKASKNNRSKVENERINDYFDWMLEGTKIFEEDDDDEENPDKAAGKGKHWFRSPPKYKPSSPPASLTGDYDFCGYGNREKPYFVPQSVPRHILLYQSMYRKFDELFVRAEKPAGAFPGYALPRWLNWSLDQKLPLHTGVPKGTAYWTRGHLGESLRPRNKGVDFKLDDPLNLHGIEYDPLHDEQCLAYFERGVVRDQIYNQKLINEDGQVLCTQKEQNLYRNYLRYTSWRDDCEIAYKMMSERRTYRKTATQYFQQKSKKWPEKKLKWHQTIKRAKKIANEKRQATKRKVEVVEREHQMRLDMLNHQKKMQNEARLEHQEIIHQSQSYYKKKNMDLAQINYEKKIDIVLKQVNADENRKAYILDKQMTAGEKKRISWQNKLYAMEKQKKLKNWAVDVTRDERMHRIGVREERVLAHRKRLPELKIERKLEELRIKGIVRKYAMRWLNKVREKRLLAKDPVHISLFNVTKSLDSTVGDLHEIAGSQKFDNLILGLLGALNFKALLGPKHKARRTHQTLEILKVEASGTNEFTYSKFPMVASSTTTGLHSSTELQEFSEPTAVEFLKPAENKVPAPDSLSTMASSESEFSQKFHHKAKKPPPKVEEEEEEEPDDLDEDDEDILDYEDFDPDDEDEDD